VHRDVPRPENPGEAGREKVRQTGALAQRGPVGAHSPGKIISGRRSL
jgi:hypothetical protein